MDVAKSGAEGVVAVRLLVRAGILARQSVATDARAHTLTRSQRGDLGRASPVRRPVGREAGGPGRVARAAS